METQDAGPEFIAMNFFMHMQLISAEKIYAYYFLPATVRECLELILLLYFR